MAVDCWDCIREVLDAINEALFIYDEDGRILAANAGAGLVYGYDFANTSSYKVGELSLGAPPYSRAEALEWIRRALSEPQNFEWRSRRSSGELFWADVSLCPCKIGGLPRVVARVRDKTSLKQAADSERRFNNLVQHSEDLITLLDAQGKRTYVSGPVDRFFGYTSEELLGQNAFDMLHPEDGPTVSQAFVNLVAHPGSIVRADYRVRHKDGSWVFVEAVGTNLLHDPAINGIVLNTRDITARKRGELELQEKEERYRLLSELSGQLIHDYDVGKGRIEWAGRVPDITGYASQEFDLLGFPASEALLHPEDRAKTVLALAQSKVKRQPFQATYRLRKKDDTYLHVAHQGTFLYDESGKPQRMLGSVKDESQRIQHEREQEKLQEQLHQAIKMEAVGQLAGGIAHDFNNLLTVITGNLELTKMELGEIDPSLLANLDEIDKASQSAIALTRQLLAFSRRQTFERKVLNLNDLVLNLHKMLSRVIGEDVVLETALDENLAPVRVDPSQFEHVLINLAVNARDAMPGGGRLKIATENFAIDELYCFSHPYTRPGAYIRLSVSDNGQGISQEAQSHIFEPFYTTKASTKGTGLGLSMVFGVVKQSGGSIEVVSEVGQGTTFFIYLPSAPGRVQQIPGAGPDNQLPGGSETILLVEDADTVRKLAYRILSRLGYRVLSASGGAEALALAEEHGNAINLMMTDVVMPEMNGRELAERIHRLYPDMKVLFTSGYAQGLIHKENADTVNFIGKPYTLGSLAKKVREVIDGPGGVSPP